MGFMNDKKRRALITGEYFCAECGSLMKFTNEYRDTLLCPGCGHEIDLEMYGCEDESYEELYPTKEELIDD